MTGTLHRHTCKVPDPHTLSVCPTRDNAETFCFQAKTAEISVVPLYVHLLDELPTRHALLFSCHLSLYVDSSHGMGRRCVCHCPCSPWHGCLAPRCFPGPLVPRCNPRSQEVRRSFPSRVMWRRRCCMLWGGRRMGARTVKCEGSHGYFDGNKTTKAEIRYSHDHYQRTQRRRNPRKIKVAGASRMVNTL